MVRCAPAYPRVDALLAPAAAAQSPAWFACLQSPEKGLHPVLKKLQTPRGPCYPGAAWCRLGQAGGVRHPGTCAGSDLACPGLVSAAAKEGRQCSDLHGRDSLRLPALAKAAVSGYCRQLAACTYLQTSLQSTTFTLHPHWLASSHMSADSIAACLRYVSLYTAMLNHATHWYGEHRMHVPAC